MGNKFFMLFAGLQKKAKRLKIEKQILEKNWPQLFAFQIDIQRASQNWRTLNFNDEQFLLESR